MAEIELKAHVKDRETLIATLNKVAHFTQAVTRDDQYWGMEKTSRQKIRIRKETLAGTENNVDSEPSVTYLLTYKRKEKVLDQNGVAIEVNDEKETQIDSPEPLECFLRDTGFSVQLKKHKEVTDWTLPVSAAGMDLSATFELCAVPPLGDFLEIEIISPSTESEVVEILQKKLLELLDLTGIPRSQIEDRYYSEMLREIGRELN